MSDTVVKDLNYYLETLTAKFPEVPAEAIYARASEWAEEAERRRNAPNPAPCPDWCTEGADEHDGYDIMQDAEDTYVRWHSTDVGGAVSIVQQERWAAGTVTFDPAQITVDVDNWAGLTAAQAGQLAFELESAAEQLEAINQ